MNRVHYAPYGVVLSLLMCWLPQALRAGSTNKPLVFIENVGQIVDQNGNARPDVLYKIEQPGISIFICRDGLQYQFYAPEATVPYDRINSQERMFTMRRVDVGLVGANRNSSAKAAGQQPYQETFYTNNLGGATAHSFSAVIVSNVYPGIDWKIYAKSGQLEYDFMLHPNADASNIRIKYAGADSIAQTTDGIRFCTPLGYVSEKNTRVFDSAGRIVPARLSLHDSELSFDLLTNGVRGTYIIDPTLEWATYFGGSGVDNGMALAADKKNNMILAGVTRSTANIATTGALQTTFGGGWSDGYISKFSQSGGILWSTYFGGEDYDQVLALSVDTHNNILAGGETQSLTGIATPGAYKTVKSGIGNDGFLAKFDENGIRLWSTYFGGDSDDQVHAIAVDGSDNVYAAGSTRSPTGIATAGAFQTTFGGGSYDGYIAAFSPSGNLDWSTYFGGSLDDGITTIKYGMGRLYVAGSTSSTANIATVGAPHTFLSGSADGFISIFDLDGSIVKSTYWGGNGEDVLTGMDINAGGIYIAGGTTSVAFLSTSGAYQSTYGGGTGDAFIAKLDTSLNTVWSTYFGGGNEDIFYGIAADSKGNLAVTGFTNSSNGICTANATQTALLGIYNTCVGVFDINGNCHWSSYYGGTGDARGVAVCMDTARNVYITGRTTSADGIATTGAYQTVEAGGDDAYLAKFGAFDLTGINEQSTWSRHLFRHK